MFCGVTNNSVTNLSPIHNFVRFVSSTATTKLKRTLRPDRDDIESRVLDIGTMASSGTLTIHQEVKPSFRHTLFVTSGQAEVIVDTLFTAPTNKASLERAPKGKGRSNGVDLEVRDVDVNVGRATVGVIDNRTLTLEPVKQTTNHVANFGSLDRTTGNKLKTTAQRTVRLNKPNSPTSGSYNVCKSRAGRKVRAFDFQLNTYVAVNPSKIVARKIDSIARTKSKGIVGSVLKSVNKSHDYKSLTSRGRILRLLKISSR